MAATWHHRGMSKARVMIANEPLVYREAIAGCFQELRPHLEVLCVEPEDLGEQMARLETALVVCSRLTESVKRRSSSWIVLYPDADLTEMSVGGQYDIAGRLQLDGLLSILDQVESLA